MTNKNCRRNKTLCTIHNCQLSSVCCLLELPIFGSPCRKISPTAPNKTIAANRPNLRIRLQNMAIRFKNTLILQYSMTKQSRAKQRNLQTSGLGQVSKSLACQKKIHDYILSDCSCFFINSCCSCCCLLFNTTKQICELVIEAAGMYTGSASVNFSYLYISYGISSYLVSLVQTIQEIHSLRAQCSVLHLSFPQ